jgi:GAF domain-containing protein/ActR/RegA family two-component response regulator
MTDEARDTGLLRVLLVEDEDSLRIPLAKYLERECSYEVTQAAHAKEARRLLSHARRPFDVALVDDLLAPSAEKEPEYLGITLLREIKGRWPETAIIIFTGWGMERALEALQAGAYRYLEKPVHPEELGLTIRMAAEQARLRKERDLLSAAIEISNAMISAADANTALEVIAEAVPRLTGANACAVALINPLTGKIRHEPVILLGDESLIWTRHLRHGFLTRQIAETGKPYAVTDTDTCAEELDENLCKSGVKSFIGVPIPAEVRNLGALYAYSLRPNGFGLHEEQVLTLLAQQAGIALENTRLFDTMRRASEQLSALNQVVLEIGKELDRQALLTQVLDQAIKLLAAEGGAVYLLDPTGEYFTMEVAAGLWLDLKGQRIGRSEGLSGQILRTAEPQKVTDYYHWQKRLRILDAHKLRAVAGAPIRVGDCILGTLVVHDTRPEKKFDDTALTLLQQFANHVGLALQKVALLEKLQVIQQMSTTITSALELEEVLNRTCQAAIELFGVDHSGLVLFDADLKWGTVEGEYPAQPNTLGERIPIKGVPAEERLAFKGETLVFSDVEEAESDLGPVLDMWRRFDIRSMLLVPIIFQNRMLGSFSLDAVGHTRQFTEEEVELCKVFAAHVAVAVENAELFAQTQRNLHMVSRLYEISSRPYSVHDPDQTLQLIAESVKEVTGALSVSITALDTAGRPYEKAHTGYTEKERVVRRHGLSTEVMRTGEPYIISDIAQVANIVNPGMIKSGVKAAICLPLRIRSRNAGVMWIAYAQPHHFADAEIKFLGLIASYASAVIETARLFQEREFLLETSQMILSAQDLDQSLQVLAERLVRSLVVTFCRISLLDDTGRSLTTRAAYPILSDLAWNPGIGQSYLLDEAPDEAKAIETGQRQILRLEQSPDLLSSLKHRTSFQDVLKVAVLIPLTVGKELFGVITLGERRHWEHGSFALERVALCEAVADQVAALIARMRLQKQAERDLDNIRRLYEASSVIGSALDPDQTLQFIVEKACQAVEGWRAAAVLLDESNQPHRLAAIGFDKEIAAATSIRPNGISMEVLRTGEPYLVEDVMAQTDKVNPAMIQDDVGAAICLPLRLGERNIGILWIQYQEPCQFVPAQIEALKLYATQAAIAYDNARRIQELDHMRRAAEALAGAAGVQEVLRQIVKSAVEVLQANSSAIWSYDSVRHTFFPQELVAEGISPDLLETFRQEEPQPGKTTYTILERRFVEITNIESSQAGFLGQSTRQLLREIGAVAFQGIALKVADEQLGVLYVNYNQPRSFAEEDRSVLETFANHAALALKKARLLDQVSKARDTAKIVAEVSVLEDLRSTLNSIARGTQDALRCDAVTLYTYDQSRDEFGFPPAMVGVRDTGEVLKFGLVARESVIRKILALDEAHVAEDASSDSLMGGAFVKREQIKSSVGIPLKVGDRKVGVMFVNYRSRHRFTADELTNINLFAHQAAVAIRNAQLYEETTRRANALEALYAASQTVTGTLAIDEILNRIVEQAWRLTEPCGEKTHFSHLALLDGNRIGFVAAHPPEALTRLQEGVHEIDLESDMCIGITGRVVVTRQSQLVGNVLEDPNYIETDPRVHSQLGVPIQMGEQVIGVINVEHPDYNAFDKEDRQALQSLAAQAAIAIENARHFEDLKKIKGYIGSKTAVDWIRMVSTAWGHAIRREVGTALGRVALLRGSLTRGESTQEVEKELDQLENVIKGIKEIPITAPLSYEDAVGSVQINDLVKTHLERKWKHIRYKPVELCLDLQENLDSIATVRVGPEWLRRAVEILTDNSVQVMLEANSPEKQLTVTTRLVGEMAEISIRDTGPGIPEDVLEKLFKEPIDKPVGSRGAGIGLMLAQTIVQTYGGVIRVEPPGEIGADMVIVLPIEN